MNPETKQHREDQICVVMGTYNGFEFLEEQIESILDQSCHAWNLLIRDDHSSDRTPELLSRYADVAGVTVIQAQQRLGVIQNFNQLLQRACATDCRYVALSDQDDVWDREKLATQLRLMQQLESEQPDQPLLVHSDLEVVDQHLRQIAPSFMNYQGIRHETSAPLQVLLVQNFVTGCTVLVNRRLLELALPIPEETLMHDWWLAQCAAALGTIACVEAPLIQYRQHGRNEVGAKQFSRFLNPFRNNYYQLWNAGRTVLTQSLEQARALAERVRQFDSTNPQLPMIEEYAQLQQAGSLGRVKKIHQLRIHSQSKLRHQLMLSRLINLPRKRAA
ncbi:UDP-Glc:alpha-D-GlcNAc-diphosphoundecaprenol beta-1,3-glucosyltransferase WfgD [Gimesia panareensis]|uniref:UDP-Glc:alpha-D-GlcNAc-diphosphoundecaprenol beta-1,3-glucosyltransferase WfgD n=1 Tax=Gimesia panareensis TaxID=2527978 RepID=A0A518FTV5_9PLAN|nr:glycosyltransferase family 2 protein [Gimesia panareensis]QDV19772.1 UDP-Glc:alpha-D-GlcNAc-diphosphoundecaprenol beta-1,3-glucosyltransferase WfgD [Gimesia panareensis]